MKNDTQSPELAVWGMLFILGFIWGGSFLFGRILMLEWPPFTVALFRVAIAAACLWVFLLVTSRKMPLENGFVVSLLVMGLINNAIPFSLILIGQQEIGSGLASVVNAMTPIWTLVIANFMTTDERFSPNKILGVALGFLGVAVLIGSDIVEGLSASAWAQTAVLGATISYGFAGVYGKRFRQHEPVIVSTGQLTASSLILLPVAFLLEDPTAISTPDLEMITALLGLGVVCTAIAYILFFRILARAGATHVSLVTFLVPVSGILLGVAWLGETLTATNLIGMALIMAGLVSIDGRIFRKSRNPET